MRTHTVYLQHRTGAIKTAEIPTHAVKLQMHFFPQLGVENKFPDAAERKACATPQQEINK